MSNDILSKNKQAKMSMWKQVGFSPFGGNSLFDTFTTTVMSRWTLKIISLCKCGANGKQRQL